MAAGRDEPKHSDRSVYIIWVLWLVGMSEASIAKVALKRPKQVAGIVTRSPYRNRSGMTDAERREKLTELLAARIGDDGQPIDGGILDRVPLRIIPLRGKQRKGRAQ